MKNQPAVRLWWHAMTVLAAWVFTLTVARAEAQAGADWTEQAQRQYEEASFLSGYMQQWYTDETGIQTNEINDVCQTADGYVWIASYSGLVRFDGKRFELFHAGSTPSLAASSIITLHEDQAGRLWIGSNDNGLHCLEGGAFTAVPNGGLGTSVRDIAEDANGNLYVATTDGMGQVTAEGELRPLADETMRHSFIQEIAVDRAGRLWAVSVQGDLYCIQDGAVMRRFPNNGGLMEDCISVYAAPDGFLYIGTAANGLIKQHEDGTREVMPTGTLKSINGCYADREGRLWVCADNGLGFFGVSGVMQQVEGTLVSNSLERIIQDYEGSYWVVSSRQGVLKLTRSKFFNLSLAAGLPDAVVNSTLGAWGNLYAATDDGLFMLDASGKPATSPLTEQLEGVRVRQLYLDRNNRMWISTYDTYGVMCAEQDGSVSYWNQENSALSSNRVRSVLERANGQMLVATAAGVDVLEEGRVVGHYGEEQGLTNTVALSLCEDRDGLLYMGSDGNGIYRIDTETGEVTNLTQEDGLSTGVILRMALDPRGRGIWISTGNQLDYLNLETGAVGPAQFPPRNSNIFDIQFIGEDQMVLLTAKGLHLIGTDSLLGGGTLDIETYERNAGLSSTVTANSWSYISGEGHLYVCVNTGINVIPLSEIYRNREPPRLKVNSIDVDGRRIELKGDRVTIPSDVKRVTIDFAVLSFVDGPSVSVTYQMEGFDASPITVRGAQLVPVSYTNLRGGTYTFSFSAVNGDGVPSAGRASVILVKDRMLREYPLFWCVVVGGLALLAALLVALTWRHKMRRVRQRQQGYRDITEQALQTIANTIDVKDPYTNGHSVRVAGYSRELARRMGLSEQEQENIYYIALLHDIGKIGIPDAILNKPGKLTDEEFTLMRSHASVGGDILKDFTALPLIGEGALHHHENVDGSGYPQRLSGDEIPLVAKVIRVADSYDAMATRRSYREPMSREYILSEFLKYSGVQFEESIATLMVEMIREGFELPHEPALRRIRPEGAETLVGGR